MKIDPNEVQSFEKFAYQFYQEQGRPDLGLSSFGKGVYAVNSTTGNRYHDTSGNSGQGKYQMLLPVIEATDLVNNAAVLMFNTYSQHARVHAIDYSFDCIQELHKSPLDCTASSTWYKMLEREDLQV